MIKLVVLTGFLGAGKTTFLKRLIEGYDDIRTGVIINEFGAVNVDAELIKGEGIDMVELSNGSIFCACIKDKFVESLIQMSARDIEYLFIEASGLADPASMSGILSGIGHMLAKPYDYVHSVCIIDGAGFVELSEVLVALRNQVTYSDIIIVNKADLIDDQEYGAICGIIGEINPSATVIRTSYCGVDVRGLIDTPSGLSGATQESTNTPESRPQTMILKGKAPVEEECLKRFLEEIAAYSYRIKGFIQGTESLLEVSCVGEQIRVQPWPNDIDDTQLVVISSVGIRIVSEVCAAIERHVKGKITL